MYEHKLFTHCRTLQPGRYQVKGEPYTIELIGPETGTPELNIVPHGHECLFWSEDELVPEHHAETIQYDRATKIASYCRMIDCVRTIVDRKNTALTVTGCIRGPPRYSQKLADILDATYRALLNAKRCDHPPGLLLRRDALEP